MTGPDARAEAVVVAAGRTVWNRARADQLASRLEAADDLILAIDTYDLIHCGILNPADRWPDLEDDPQPWETGLRRAAEAVLRKLAEVIRQAPALAGDAPQAPAANERRQQ